MPCNSLNYKNKKALCFLTRIAAIGAIFYLLMDISIHWGLFRYLRKDIDFNPIVPAVAIIFDTIILVTFVVLKYKTDPLVLFSAATGFILIIIGQQIFMKSHTDNEGNMDMSTDMDKDMNMEMDKEKDKDMDMDKS